MSFLSNKYNFLGKRLKKYVFADFFIGIVWFGVESSFIFILQGFLISLDLVDKKSAMLPSWYPLDLGTNLIILFSFGFARSLLVMCKNYLNYFTGQVFIYEKRKKILEDALLRKNINSHEEILSVFSETVTYASNYVIHFCNFLHNIVVTILFSIICLSVAYRETIVGIIGLACLYLPLKILAKRVNSNGEQLQDSWRISHKTLLNSLKNILFLRLYGMISEEVVKGSDALKKYENNYHQYSLNSSIVLSLPQFVGIFILCVVAYVGKIFWQTDSSILLSFFYLFIRFSQSASLTSHSYSYLKLTRHSFDQLIDFMDRIKSSPRVEIRDAERFEKIKIQALNLACGYDKSMPIIENINLDLERSDFLLIRGASGSGKSTLLKSMLGEIPLLGGHLLINNDKSIVPGQMIDVIGYVGPEPYLVYDTVRNNLLYGNKLKISDTEIWIMLKKLGIENVVRNLPSQLDEILLDDAQLSTGQRQRISFARALLRHPLLLVLDEATANIDKDTESLIISTLEYEKKNMICVAVSHHGGFDMLANKFLNLT
ncbi:MAG: hypothetical protein COV38_03140 [Bdellovibrionales bacterium CG11_big_fil_rev_8_21_14_0_20_38_13]|nr:MAG: hypothetical protein COW79_06745 [Bdellovibrionales bacterium CG22_combo_CG10-13_8_21_14_all_38_13]PIR30900.1 MAG: hypothetical protein COV38_03140 [Bdellovibrionales bacterium CG11_big_fil_rev_8_21_14_0_20_38_13]